jgi:uncharacterized protein YoxC
MLLPAAVLIVIVWMVFRSRGRTELLTTEQDTLIQYIDSKDDISPVAFIVAEMSKAVTTKNDMFDKVLTLASENKKDELKTLITEN